MAILLDSLAVLIVDETPEVLVFLARLLWRKNIRALLARDWQEAIGIAERNYVPIDLVLVDVVIPRLSAAKLMDRMREIRPGVGALYMSAQLDSAAIRVQLTGASAPSALKGIPGEGCCDLIESIHTASRAPFGFPLRFDRDPGILVVQ
jgi:CheY-like chemotaxis protein